MDFEIKHEQDGTYTIYQGRSILGYEDDLDFAMQMVRQHKGDKYTLVEQDGYRTPYRI